MVIRILICGNVAMMLVVFWKKLPIEIVGKKYGRNPAGQVVEFFVGGDDPVHCIVSCNEQSGVQVHLQQYCDIGQWIGPIDGYAQKKNEGCSPECDYTPAD